MIIKKDLHDTVSNEELTELKLRDGILDVSSFLYRSSHGFISLPHIYEIIDFLFRNVLIIKNIGRGAGQLYINFHIDLYVGRNQPHINTHNHKDVFTTISVVLNDKVLCDYILDNYGDCKVIPDDVKNFIRQQRN